MDCNFYLFIVAGVLPLCQEILRNLTAANDQMSCHAWMWRKCLALTSKIKKYFTPVVVAFNCIRTYEYAWWGQLLLRRSSADGRRNFGQFLHCMDCDETSLNWCAQLCMCEQGTWWYRSIKYSAQQVLIHTSRLYLRFLHKSPNMILKREFSAALSASLNALLISERTKFVLTENKNHFYGVCQIFPQIF